MSRLTFDELKRILTECSGVDDPAGLGDETLDTAFTDLGYDSLALLETAAVVARRFGVELSDAAVTRAETPREFLDLANAALTRAA
jgi:act minimal PKS acyl carrier protein